VDGTVITILVLAGKGLVIVIFVDIIFLNVYTARLETRIAGLCAELGLLFYPGFAAPSAVASLSSTSDDAPPGRPDAGTGGRVAGASGAGAGAAGAGTTTTGAGGAT
jgi:hypothetical protein